MANPQTVPTFTNVEAVGRATRGAPAEGPESHPVAHLPNASETMEDRQPNGGETARGTGPMNVHPRLGGTNTPRNQGDNAESVAPAAGRAYSTERAQGANGGSATSSSRGVDYPSNDSGSAGRM